MDRSELKGMLISLAVKLLVLVSLYLLCDYFQFPLGLTASLLLFAFALVFMIMHYNKFKTAQKVGFIGLAISAGLLSILFAYDHFIEDIRITVIHIGAIILPPLLIGSYLLKKDKEKT